MNNIGFFGLLLGGVVVCSLIGCDQNTTSSSTYTRDTGKNNYQDMKNRGHSEEDAVIFGILKQQGYSDYDALNATKSSK